jgi:hypothetical protein
MLHSAPRAVNRGQKSEYRIDGRFAAAAIAKASPTRNATLMPFAEIPPSTATIPTATAVIRATRTSSRGSACPRRSTPAYARGAKECGG